MRDWDLFEWFLAALFAGGCIVGTMIISSAVRDHKLDNLPTTVYDRGGVTVLKNENCQGSKYSYNCDITMSDGMRFQTDLSDWPSGMLYPNTRLTSQVRTNGIRQQYVYCNAQYCHTYMSCYKSECFNQTYAKGNENVP